ncbi:Aste57867_23873 [Aphanomyces stellatus]|uniref:Aste57867_23873 protein n=1 Tax=Aphanomyces stellatus TaxID=120398 RepID=A0A485LNZ0_9STRA|nr:hypothetical protein As57867_023800 [Aphanomyces stellatus]VFU00516.1 Aste57867_23873 [Aphanomyces stellatus]
MPDAVHIAEHLTCAYFHAGGTVRGYVKVDSPRPLYIEWGVAQVHGHLCVDSDVLTVPLVSSSGGLDESFMKTLNLPDVKTFSGPTGVCLFQSKPTVLYSEMDVPLTTQTHFAIGLPTVLCPSFKGTSARVFYVLSITLKFQGTADAQCLHLPFDVYAGKYVFQSPVVDLVSDGAPSPPIVLVVPHPMLTSPTDENRATPVAVRRGMELPFELKPRLMHGRVETERAGSTQTRQYTIGQQGDHLVVVKFFKQRYMPGDVILIALDFGAATLACQSVTAALVLEERLGALSLDPGRVVAKHTLHTMVELTSDTVQTHMRFALAVDTKVSIDTDLVEHHYVLAFAFESIQTLEWHVPVDVVPPLAPDASHLNVPDPVYNGPTRTRTLFVQE